MGSLQDMSPDLDYGYYWVTRLSTALSLVSVLLCAVLHTYDKTYN